MGHGAPAQAGGFDTPMLYSARHMGMGGTAVSSVRDPSALFHNPAGLAHTKRISLLGDFSLLLGKVQGSPNPNAPGIESETTVAPFFLLGASFRLNDWMTAGIAVFPSASAGGSYTYDVFGAAIDDETKIVFFEVSPGVAFELPGNVNVGFGYRVTFFSLDRTRVVNGNDDIDAHLSGVGFLSFRAGAQWTPLDESPDDPTQGRRLSVGANYRHKSTVDADASEAVVGGSAVQNAAATFRLPGKIAFGVRGDCARFGSAIDLEYTLNSQNDESIFTGTQGGRDAAFPSVFEWSNAVTLRWGLEYRALAGGELALRLGYVWDQKTANRTYPTAFGTPPAATHVFTTGAGYDGGPWEVHAAYAFRTSLGTTEITTADVAPGRPCAFCGTEGDYGLTLHGLYVDFSWEFD